MAAVVISVWPGLIQSGGYRYAQPSLRHVEQGEGGGDGDRRRRSSVDGESEEDDEGLEAGRNHFA